MTTDAGHERTDERTRPRRALHRLIPAAKPRHVEEAAYSISRKSVEQGKPEERNVPRSSQEKLGEAVRGRETLGAWAGCLRYYGLALLLVAVGVMVRMALTRLVGPGLPPYITFYPLVMLAALIGGWGPGLLVTLATAALVNYWLLLPARTFRIGGMADAVGLAFFCVMGVFVSIVAEFYRRTRDHLDELVVVRTAALSQTNEQLHQEVAERSHAEEALRKSEEQFRAFFHIPAVGTAQLGLDGRFLEVNDRLCQITGYSGEELLRMGPADLTHPEDRQQEDEYLSAYLQGLTANYEREKRYVRKDGQVIWVQVVAALIRDAQGKPLRSAGVIRDITERKKAEAALKESEEKYRLLFDNMTEGFGLHEIILDAEGEPCDFRFLQLNDAWEKLTGISRAKAIGRTMKQILPDIDSYWIETYGRVALTGEPVHYENYNSPLRKWYETYAFSPRKNEFALVFSDVTERRQGEELVRASEQRFRALTERSADVVAIFDPEGKIAYISPSIRALFGFAPEEIVGQSLFAFIHPDDAERTQALIAEALRDPTRTLTSELRTRHQNGQWRWIAVAGRNLMADPTVGGLVANFQDITTRKQVEEALKESEEKYRSLFESMTQLFVLCEIILDGAGKPYDYRYVEANPAVLKYLNLPREMVIGKTLREITSRIDPYLIEIGGQVALTGEPLQIERFGVVGDRWFNLSFESPRKGYFTVLGTDVTERKRAEEALRESEERLKATLHSMRDEVWIVDAQGRIVLINEAVQEHLGVTPDRWEDIYAAIAELEILRPDGTPRPAEQAPLARALRGEVLTGVQEMIRNLATGVLRWREVTSAPIRDPAGQTTGAVVVARDITERKQAEEALRQAKTFTDKLLNAPLDTVFLFEPATGKPVRWNKRFAEVSGYRDEEIAGMKAPDDFYDEDDLQKAQEGTRRTLADGQGVVVLSLITKQGVPIPFEYAGTVVQGEDGKTLLLSVGRDITERKQAEEALRESEQRYRKLFEANLAGVYLSKLDGTILDCNEAVLRMMGYSSRQEVLGRRASDFYVDPESRQELVRLLQRDGVVPARETVLRRKDGSILHAFGSAVLLVNEQTGEPYVQGVAIDITQRKEAEESLRELTRTLESKVAQRTAELRHRAQQLQKLTLDMSEAEDRERKRMAEILHDDLQQIIAGAKFHLNLLRHRVRYDASVQALGAQIDQMLKDAIEKSRGLSHELSPAVLHHRDFTETLGWLAGQMRNKHGLVVHVHAPGKVDLQSDAITALLYRTAQELLFNVVKHARVNEAGLRVRRRGRYVCLSVSDRGRGFDPQVLREATGYGLLSIRERIELLGGRMRIKSAAGKGSAAFIVVPDSGVHEATAEAGTRSNGPAAVGERATHEERGRIRVLLADDHQIVREGLRLLLREEYDIEIVGEAAHGREAVDLALRLEPDVVIMDVSMPLIDGDAATRQIKEYLPQTRVIALSTYNEPEKMERMYRAGAEGYVLKTASSEELLAALRGKEPHWQKKPV